MHLTLRVLTLNLLIASVASSQEPSRTLTGLVVDSTGAPLPYVNVIAGSNRVVTSVSGNFSLRTDGRGQVKLSLVRIGFHRVDTLIADDGSNEGVTIRMIPLEVRLSTVRVLGERMSGKLAARGYYDRMQDVERGINRGYFITPEELERRRPNMITQMVEGYPSIRVRRTVSEEYAQITGVGNCKMTVYLDGIRIVGKLGAQDDYVNMIVRPNEVAGVEIYPSGVTAPPQYQSLNGSCGVVLIWTR